MYFVSKEWTQFKKMAKGEAFRVLPVKKKVRMDFDMKRKPDRGSFEARFVRLDGEEYEIATFSTVPFEDVNEFLEYRRRKDTMRCLRTMEDWEKFFFREEIEQGTDIVPVGMDGRVTKIRVRDPEWAVLNSCIMGHRAGLWKIDALDMLKGKRRVEWVNEHNTSRHKFKDMDWKNANSRKRQESILPYELIESKLDELQAAAY